jgi:hypothetical protein
MSLSRHSMAIIGHFSTNRGSCGDERHRGVEWMKDLLRGELTLVDEGRLGFDLGDDLLLVHGREGHGRPGERTAHDV